MNLKEKLLSLINRQKGILDKAKAEGRVFTNEESAEWKTIQADIDNTKAMIAAEEQLEVTNKELNTPVTPVPHVEVKPGQVENVFSNLVENLKSCKAAQNGNVDDKMRKIMNASGGQSGVGEDGAFLIEKQFTQGIMKSAVDDSPILSRVKKLPIGAGFNGAKWTDVDETSVATSVYGGVIAYWSVEAGTVTATKPKFAKREITLQKLMGLAYVTDELDEDSVFISGLYQDAFKTAIGREAASAIISGNGVGKPLGILSSAGTVSVAKESGQTAATVAWENLVKMYNRAKRTPSSVWILHPDVQQQLDLMYMTAGTAGVPVYLPASANGSVPSIKGLPIIESDHCSALGTAGDIILADLNEYLWITKGDIKTDVSIHVKFEYAENAWRFILRCNGAPMKNSPLTIKNSSNTRSSFVTLANR